MNLPNALTVGRIAVTPLIAVLPFADSWKLAARGVRAVHLGRDHRLHRRHARALAQSRRPISAGCSIRSPTSCCSSARSFRCTSSRRRFPFVTPVGTRRTSRSGSSPSCSGAKLFMTVFRQAAARRGVVIAAIGPAKWKTGVPARLAGLRLLLVLRRRRSPPRRAGTTTRGTRSRCSTASSARSTMIGAVVLTIVLPRALPAQLRQRLRDSPSK